MRKQRWLCVSIDWLTTSIAFFLFNIYRFYHLRLYDVFSSLEGYLDSQKLILEQLFVPTALLVVYWLSGYYNKPFERSRLNEFLMTLYSQLFNSIVIYLGALTNDQTMMRKENWMLLLILFAFLFICNYSGRLLLTNFMMRKFEKLKYAYKTVIIGSYNESVRLIKTLKNSQSKLGYKITGILLQEEESHNKYHKSTIEGLPILTSMEEIGKLTAEGNIDQVILAPSKNNHQNEVILNTLYSLFPHDIAIRIKPDLMSYITPSIMEQDILAEPFLDISRPRISEFNKNVKRSLDVIISSLSLILLSPFLAGIVIYLKLSSKGPIIYSQERIGYHRRPFKIYKFRSMVTDAEQNGPQLSNDDDPRITPVGKWMRKYRIDELPQFWNVIKGEMSIVGPRPERSFYIDQIIKKAPWYSLIHQVRPGLTSWGMVKFGYATTIDEMIERNRFDLVYLANMSVAVDFKILIHTINTIIKGEGK